MRNQGARCMDCSIPFCHQGCPLGNLIPDWNDLVYQNRWREAIDRLHATNNFPGVDRPAVPGAVRGVVRAGHQRRSGDDQVDRASRSSIAPSTKAGLCAEPPARRTGKRVAVVGSGPAGLAAAQQLNRAGHLVTVFERDDRIGGLLRYGIPEFKMEKRVPRPPARRCSRPKASSSGAGVNVGVDVPAERAARGRSTRCCSPAARLAARPARCPGRELAGIHFAMEYLTLQNRRCEGDAVRPTAVHHRRRQARRDHRRRRHRRRLPRARSLARARASVHQFELLPRPPDRARAEQSLAGMAATSSASRRRTKRAASASSRCRPSGSRATPTGACAQLHAVEGGARRRKAAGRRSSRSPGSEFSMRRRSGAARDGVRRARARRAARRTSACG